MRHTTAALLTTAALAALAGATLRASPPVHAPSPGKPIRGYKRWTRVNPTPHRVWSRLAALCAAPTPLQLAQGDAGPHKDKFVTVYVNEAGVSAMIRAKTPVFPRGTVIVKEKAASASGGPPELLTVMRKREQGYDPAGGDWQYLILNGAATQVTAEGRLQTCRACHIQWRTTDYVSREYLPADVAGALR